MNAVAEAQIAKDQKCLVHLAYDCESGYRAADARWEIWNHRPEIGYQPCGRCYVTDAVEFSLDGVKSLGSTGKKIEALVAYNKNKEGGRILDISDAEDREAGPFRMRFNPSREKRGWRLLGQVDDPESPGCVLDAAQYSNNGHGVPEFLEWKDYCLFPNPYPIYMPDHFTLSKKRKQGMKHMEQVLAAEEIRDAFDFLHEAPYFRVFFNGIGAGASIPDHFHFQGFSHNLPVEHFPRREIKSNRKIKISAPVDYPATVFVLEGDGREELAEEAHKIVGMLNRATDGMEIAHNLLFLDIPRRIYIFPRRKIDIKTPEEKENEKRHYDGSLPASVEMCGTIVISDMAYIERYKNMSTNELENLAAGILRKVTILKDKLHPV